MSNPDPNRGFHAIPKHTLSVKYLKLILGDQKYSELLSEYMKAKEIEYRKVYERIKATGKSSGS